MPLEMYATHVALEYPVAAHVLNMQAEYVHGTCGDTINLLLWDQFLYLDMSLYLLTSTILYYSNHCQRCAGLVQTHPVVFDEPSRDLLRRSHSALSCCYSTRV